MPASAPAADGLTQRLEALLFVAGGPATAAQLAAALGVSPREVEHGLQTLDQASAGRGIRLQWHHGAVQLTTASELAQDVEHFLNLEGTTRLTRAALEVLAIVAYEQPVTRPKIDSVRGVNSETALQTLLRHGLVEEVGRAEGAGRPILYATTPEFLQHFGLTRLSELPPLQVEARAESAPAEDPPSAPAGDEGG
ncbi:MAG: SMC-Scp complex subunit ScpB [Anaerolineales bacterium]|nr:SMC-Scp complex subunit ScpB [Anaerolineales bacterium]